MAPKGGRLSGAKISDLRQKILEILKYLSFSIDFANICAILSSMKNKTPMNIDLLTLLNNYGWSKRKIGREVGVSNVAVLNWLKGAEIREVHVNMLRAVVEANRYIRKPAYDDFDGRKPTETKINVLTKLHRYGVSVEEIAKISGVPSYKLWRVIKCPNEFNSNLFDRLIPVEHYIRRIHGKEIITDLLDFLPF